MRPALVWGWARYPSRSSVAMSERTVAEDTLTPGASTTCWDPTGWADPMYSVTTALRMAALRASRSPLSGSVSPGWRSSVVGMAVLMEVRTPRRPRWPDWRALRWHSTLVSAEPSGTGM